MKLPIYSYRDNMVGFGSPILEQNEQTAIRGFQYAINSNKGMMNFRPKDYDLYYIGDFDLEKGVITPNAVPYMVCEGLSVVDND